MPAGTSTLRLGLPTLLLTALACASGGAQTEAANDVRLPAAPAADEASPFDDWTSDVPGDRHHIEPADLPTPVMTVSHPEESSADPAEVVAQPPGAAPRVPAGFTVDVLARGLDMPRRMRIAPNGDVFLSESGAGRVLVFPAAAVASGSATPHVFAQGLDRPYGIAFVPSSDPQYVYIAAANQVVRYPYSDGAREAAGPAEVILDNLPTERHWTKDLAVSQDGQRLYLAVGSASNLGVEGMPPMTLEQIREFEATHGRGAAWGEEENRAVVRVFDPEGNDVRNYATGLRNCSGLMMQPALTTSGAS